MGENRTYDASTGEFVDYGTMDEWRERDLAKDAEIERLRTLVEWQPIETAPKDGTEILLWSRWDWDGTDGKNCSLDYYAGIAVWDDEDSYYKSGFWSISANPYRDLAFEPTHWKPLNPPEDT